MSSILPVYDNCLTVYHKSLRDWLMSEGYKEHAFTVDSHTGHEYLWRICKKVFDQIISSSTFSSSKLRPMTRYALTHGISHMIQSGSKTSCHLSVDVRIVHARITNQIGEFEMEREWKKIVENSPSSLSSEQLQELDWHIKLFEDLQFRSGDSGPYLQSVANRIDCSNETRLLARSLLEQGHHFWFEDLDATKLTNHFCKSISLRTDVTCMCASSDEQFVAAGYKDGWISIFRVPDFQEVHTFDTSPKYMHLDRYYTNSVSVVSLWSCSFSPSSVRLITCDGSEKVKLWDVNSGSLLARLEAGGPVDCCSFSECGLFIVASKELKGNRRSDVFIDDTDVFIVWNALTLQRVDRRNIGSTQQRLDEHNRYSSFRLLADRNNKSELLLSRNDDYMDILQLFGAPVVQQYKPFSSPVLLNTTTRSHWRDCVLHHTKESIKLTDTFLYEKCPCDVKEGRPGPVTVQKLYVVPFANKLNIFSVANQPSMSIQPSFVPEQYVISCCCFSPDGSFLATCARLSILIWDTKFCTVIQVCRLRNFAEGCWWSESLLWIYDCPFLKIPDLVKIPISDGRTLEPSGARRVEIDWEPRELLTFSDVLIFIDQENSVNVARIKNGELQYVEKLPVDNRIICAAVSPCNSIILMASSKLTFHVWKEDQTSQPLHWVASNTGKLRDSSPLKDSEGIVYCKCCITSDSTKGVLMLYSPSVRLFMAGFDFPEREHGKRLRRRQYFTVVDFKSKITTRIPQVIPKLIEIYAGNSYCIAVNGRPFCEVMAMKLATSEHVSKWVISRELNHCSLIIAHSKNDLVAIITKDPASVQFLKIVVPQSDE
jgi:WD40 repeat protein